MLKDLVPKFARIVEENPTILIDNYELKDGLYIKLSLDKQISVTDKDFLVISKKDKNPMHKSELLRWFKKADSLSSVLQDSMNKAVDIPAKKIHNTNYLSLFAKKDYLLGVESNGSTDEVKNHLFHFLQVNLPKSEGRLLDLYPITAKSKKERLIQEENRSHYFQNHYPELMAYLSSDERTIKQQLVSRFWEENFETVFTKIRELVTEYRVSNYIKLFFDVDESEYEKEYEAYVLPRIYNVNDYNQLVEGEIVGLPAYDVSMNSKKPFFELKTTKAKVPTMTSLEDALTIKNFYQWLQKQGKFKELTLPFHELFGPGTSSERARNVAKGAYYLSLDKNGSIQYFDNTPFEPKSNWTLNIENVLDIQEKRDTNWVTKSYPTIEGKRGLRQGISKLFFSNFMPNNLLDGEAPKAKEGVFTTEMVSAYVMTRQALFDFLVKDTNETIRPFLKKYSLQLIENQLLKTTEGLKYKKVADAFHMRLALLKKIEDREGIELSDQIKDIYVMLKEKLSMKRDLIVCENDKEFFFLAGQLGYYLLSQTGTANRSYGIAEPILKARNPQVLKNKLADLFDTYKHAIRYDYVAFKSAMAMVQGYETNAKIEGANKNMLLAGLLANNLFYQKAETKLNEGDNQ